MKPLLRSVPAALRRLLVPAGVLMLAFPAAGGTALFPGIDENANGISDLFEGLFPGAVEPAADNDHDGAGNADEAAAGTNPNDSRDRLNFQSLVNTGGQVEALWRTIPGKLYQMQSAAGLDAAWTDEGPAVAGTGENARAGCPVSASRLFLRLKVSDTDTDADGATDWEELQAGTDRYLWDSDGDGRSDREVVRSIAGGTSYVNVAAVDSWATEFGRKAEIRFIRRGGFQPLTVPFQLGGTAVQGSDYTLSSPGQVSFPAGGTTAVVTLTALEDDMLEGPETVVLSLRSGSGYLPGSAAAATVTIVSQGLVGNYYNTSSSTHSFAPVTGANWDPLQLGLTRRDAAVHFDWSKPSGNPPGTGTGTPGPGIADDDSWGARWSGFVIPKYTEAYQILASGDRGFRVYCSINPLSSASTPRLDTWSGTTSPTAVSSGNFLSSAEVSSRILQAGRPYYIQIDYRDSSTFTNNAGIDVRWSSASQAEETIPVSALTSEGFTGAAPVLSGSPVALGLTGAPFSYAITALNAPSSYAADGLPAGLVLNTSTGVITGALSARPGVYFSTLTASNAAGSGVMNLTLIVVGTSGLITHETWTGLSGNGVASVPVWQAAATSETLPAMEAPAAPSGNFGDRLRGWLTPPVSGNYTFFASAGENVELWVSSNNEPAHRLKRSWIINGGVPTGSWTSVPTQRSYPVQLTAGESYYIEAVRRQTAPGGHFAVGWQKPGDAAPEIIPGYALSPFTESVESSGSGALYIASLTPQAGAATLGAGTAVLRVNPEKTAAALTFTYANLTGPVLSQHVHDSRSVPGPAGAILFDIDEAEPGPGGARQWTFEATGSHTVADIVAAIEGGTAFLNLHTGAFPAGEIKGVFQPVAGSQYFTPPPAPPAAELALPADPVARKNAIVRFLQQATFGARHDADGVAPWDPDSIEAVEALGYAGWIDAQLAMDKGPDPETLLTQSLPPRIHYREPTAALPVLIASGTATGYNGSGPMASFVKSFYDKFPLSGVGSTGAPLESSDEIWRAWWRTSVQSPDQLRLRLAFALSQIMVVSEDGELDELARGMVHYHDLLYWHSTGNFRTLLERVTLNPAMGRYLDMLGNRKPDPSIGYIPNENFAREILQLFSIGLRRLHPDGSVVLNAAGLPAPTYEQPNVVGYAHTFTGWNFPGSGSNYISAMVPTAGNHAFTEKLLLENTVIPASSSATAAQCHAELGMALDVIFHHPNVGPFIARQLIQRMVTANPSPAYLYRAARAFDDNGSGVRGDMGALVKAILLDPEARNAAARMQPGFGHLKEPVIRATQMLRAFGGHSYGEKTYGAANMAGTVSVSPNAAVDLLQPLPLTVFTRIGTRALYPGEVIALSGQTPSADNGFYVFNGHGQPLTRSSAAAGVATYSTDLADIVSSSLPTTSYPVVEGIPITTGTRLLLRFQANAAENGIYLFTAPAAPLVRWDQADQPAELNAAIVTVAAYRDPVTLAYSSKTFKQTEAITVMGTDPVVFADGSATAAGRRSWEMGSTGGSSLSQTPLRPPTVFNFYEPDYVFAGDTGSNGLFSPEFQITSETSVVNSANWFNELTLRNDSDTASAATNGQGYSYGNPVKRDVKLDLTAELPLAHDGGLLADRLAGLLMPGQMSPRLRSLLADYLNALPETLIPAGSAWKYFTSATGLGASNIVSGSASYHSGNWKHPDFADAAWNAGNAVLGYSSTNSGIATVIPYGSNASSKWVTSYFRREFQVAGAATVQGLTLRLKRDDGAIVYLNGQEVRRDNFTPGLVVSGTTLATGAGDNGAAFFDTVIAPSLLVEGRNVLTVEVHQNSVTSGDVFFDLELSGTRRGAPVPNVSTPDRVQRLTEALYLLSLTPEFGLQN